MNLPPLPPSSAIFRETLSLVSDAKKRGVTIGACVTYEGSPYTVDKFHGRAVRLINETGGAIIVDVRGVNC